MLRTSENALTKFGLSFLENYYQYRPKQKGGISTATNLTVNQTKINGQLTFTQPNGQLYHAIFKIIDAATPKGSVFDINRIRLLVHGFLVASFLAGILSFVFASFLSISFLKLFLLVFFSPILLLYYIGGIYSGHYRSFIFLNQLKNNKANEKWVAISHQIFKAYSNKEKDLLKKKCVQLGFGLFSILPETESNLLVMPNNLNGNTPSTILKKLTSNKKLSLGMGSFLLVVILPFIVNYCAPKSMNQLKSYLGHTIDNNPTDTTLNNSQDSLLVKSKTPITQRREEQKLLHDCGQILAHFDEHKELADLFQLGKGPHLYIMELQHLLHQLGFGKELGKPGKDLDGIYGLKVAAAIQSFAKKNNIKSDGKRITSKLAKTLQQRLDGLPFLHQLQRDLNEGKVEEKYQSDSTSKTSTSALQYVLNELGMGAHLNWKDRRNDGVLDGDVLKALRTHLKKDLDMVTDKVTPQSIFHILEDIGRHYGDSWKFHIKAFSGNKASRLYHFTASNFIGKPLIINAEFIPLLERINKYAKKNKVQIYINDSFRPANAKIRGNIVKPATHSNHKIGHGIDMNIKYEGGWANSEVMYKKNEANWPPPVKGFIDDIRKDSILRWGGDFHTSPDPVHIDDDLNQIDPKEWKALFEETQKAYENHDIYVERDE